MATVDPFADFESLRQVVRSNTVDRLKQILTGFNDECGCSLSKTGKKQDLIDRIFRQLEAWRLAHNGDKFTKARSVVHQVRTSGTYTPTRPDGNTLPPPLMHNSYNPTASGSHSYHTPLPPPPASVSRYDPYRRGLPSITGPSVPKPVITFQPSPFMRVDQTVSAVVECPESLSSVDRRQQSVQFSLNSEQLQKLTSTSTRYQLRLYCTSSTFYSPTFRTQHANAPCPVEFPPACEVRVNSVGLTANLKGLKKKPGTAPPPDLGKLVRILPGAVNVVEMVYVNSQQPVLGKKYYMTIMLVEVTSVDELVERLKKGKFVNKDDLLVKIQKGMSYDDDIVAGQQKMSLKCPLSYGRIVTPCRSSLCVHPQCFDASSWFSVMEQTTTWLCPVCEKVLKPDDLIMDGYFYDILQATPDSVEDVVMEADGQWHTSDNDYGSSDWIAVHPPQKPDQGKTVPQVAKPTVSKVSNGEERTRPNGNEVLVLDSDDEDEGRVKRELSISSDRNFPPQTQSQRTSVQTGSQASAVIDLTLDSDDEEPPQQTQKRKAIDVVSPSGTGQQTWKKARLGNSGVGSLGTESLSDNAHTNGRLSSTSAPSTGSLRSLLPRAPSYSTLFSATSDYRRPAEGRW